MEGGGQGERDVRTNGFHQCEARYHRWDFTRVMASGFSMHVGGDLIHALLVIAAVAFLFNLLRGRRSVV